MGGERRSSWKLSLRADYNGWKVPEVLLSGNPKLIQKWQDEQALARTKALRPNLLKKD